MNIEVTIRTFYKLFDSNDFNYTKRLQNANMHYYNSKENEQQGIIIHNFISNVKQYYLIDINI